MPSNPGFDRRAPHDDRPRLGGGASEVAEWETVNDDSTPECEPAAGPPRVDAALRALACEAEYDDAARLESCATKKAIEGSCSSSTPPALVYTNRQLSRG